MRGEIAAQYVRLTASSSNNLLPDDYQDPVARDKNGHWLAAFAPVLVSSRTKPQEETGWFVIVQQQQSSLKESPSPAAES